MIKNVKQYALKQTSPLALLPPVELTQPVPSSRAKRSSFRDWLHAVGTSSTSNVSLAPAITRLPKLTAMDIVRVNHATIREGESHRVWPPSVLQKFNSAKVITEKKTKHYELRDVHLKKVS